MKQNWAIYRGGRKVAGFVGGLDAAAYVAPAVRAYLGTGPIKVRYRGRIVQVPGVIFTVDSLMAGAARIEEADYEKYQGWLLKQTEPRPA